MSISTEARQGTGWIPDASTFGARLALLRQHKGWSNIAMAARACNVPVDSWRNWEIDGREPHRLTTIGKQIATASGVDYLWLVHGPDRGEGGGGMDTHEYHSDLRVIATGKRRAPGRSVRRTQPVRPSRIPRPATPSAA